MLDKEKIQAVSLFLFKMSHKAVETTHNINNAFGPGTTNKHTVRWWFKKLCMRALKMRSMVTSHQKLTTTDSHH